MKRIKLTSIAILAFVSLLWLMADNILSVGSEFFALRNSLINYTGIITMVAMSIAMILVVRSSWIESFLDGLDKSYRLHKWMGITALVVAIVHWLWAQAPKWMVGLGLLTRPARQPPADPGSEILRFFQSQRGLAEQLGEWAFYAAVVLILLALVKRFPYHLFFKVHRLLAITYLLLVFHSVVLMKFDYWGSGIGPLMAVLMTAGTVAAFMSLFRRIGHSHKALGTVEDVGHHRDNRVFKVQLKLKDRWPGHEAGQFAFITFDRREGPHPFTIASSWHGDGRLKFHIKGIGDYTATLPENVKVGDLAVVEGPYGRFEFESQKPRQIWIAGGIGITPFIARLEALAGGQETKPVDLFYSTAAPDEEYIQRLRQLAQEAKVRLHVWLSEREGRLTADRICRLVPDWQGADIWFCGPAGFGKALRHDLTAKGLRGDDFHQELFDMR